MRIVFNDLSTPALLRRCLKDGTQNRNEGLHSKLWLHQSKAKFAGCKRVTSVSQFTIIEHNMGYEENDSLASIGFPSTCDASSAKRKMDKP